MTITQQSGTHRRFYLLPEQYNWPIHLCLAFGAIMSATDPVAVVSILNSLGASSKLTMQITGESLLNDGTAVVLFNLFYYMYNRQREHDDSHGSGIYGNVSCCFNVGGIVGYFLQMAIAGPLLGAFHCQPRVLL